MRSELTLGLLTGNWNLADDYAPERETERVLYFENKEKSFENEALI